MDGNGKVDDYEFICGLALFTKTSIYQRIEAIFEVFDTDKSQVIEKKEFDELVETIVKSNNSAATAAAVKDKVQKLKASYFSTEETVSLNVFTQMVKEDDDMRKALLDKGVFGLGEIPVDQYDDDINNELNKYNFDEEAVDAGDQMVPGSILNPVGEDGMFQMEDVGGGDQFMAVKPWVGTVKNTVPDGWKPKPTDADVPDATLSMTYIHGYRCHDSRNNIFFNPDGQLVYHTALVGIQLDTKTNSQKFVTDNIDDIMSIACHDNLCATGDIGPKPALVLWDNVRMSTLQVYSGDLQKGIAMLAFSHDGKLLAASCMDTDNTLAIFDVQKLLAGERKSPKDSLLDLKFTSDNKSLVGLSKSEVYFIDHAAGTAGIKKGTGWGGKAGEKQVTLAVGVTSSETLVGAQNGKILRFKGPSISGALDAHTGSVNAIFSRKRDKGIISGGNDGVVIVWDEALTKSRVISAKDVKDFPIFNPRIRAVCEHSDGSIAFGTRSSNIVLVEASGKTRTVNNGSFDGELWGLAAIPGSDDYVTVGEDFMVCRYTTQNPRALKATKIPYMATAVEVSGDGKVIAVGCKNGHTLILNCADFSKIKEISDRKKQISDLKFSPNGKYLAVAAHDSRIRIYNTAGWKFVGECRGHHSTVTHVDWSEDSESLQSNCSSYELLFWTAASCKQNTSAKAYRNENWATWTCVIGWPVQGIFPKFSDGTDVNAVCRNKARTVLASADDFGTVKLFKYPSTEKQANANAYNGHSSHVTNVRFTAKEDFIISTGGNDKATIMWRYKPQGGVESEPEENVEVDTEGYDPDEFKVQEPEERETAPGQQATKPKLESDLFDLADEEQGDQFMAVKPFLGEVKNSWPTGFKAAPGANNAPDGNLTLRHAFGFRCHDAKDTAKFMASSKSICFITAALGVTMDITSNVQSFFNKHDEDLVSMDVTTDRKYCATGSMPAKGRSKLLDIYVWETETKRQVAFLTGFHRGAIKVLKFSPNGRLLLSVGRDENNSLAVYDWANNIKVCDSKVDRCEVFDAAWNDDNTFATITKDAIKFWSLKKGGCSAIKGAWGKDKKIVLASCTYVAGVCFSGGWNGQIIPWQGAAKGKAVDAHKGAIFCLHYDAERKLLLSGGKDGLVKAWTVSGATLTPKGVLFDYLSGNPEMKVALGIRSIDSHVDGSLLVGTREAEIYHIGKDKTISNVMKAHYDGELWAVAAHPTSTLCVSAGGDKSIRIFCTKERAILSLFFHETDVRAVDWSSDGNLIAAASVVGEILLLGPTLDELARIQSSFRDKNQWIEDIKFSPDSSMLAFGAHGGRSPIEILKVQDGKLNKYCTINVGFTSALLHLDWSVDSAFIVANSQAYELKFASVTSQQSVRASSAKDIDWSTWTCKLGFPVQGIFPGVDGTDVNTVCRASNRKVMATGDDFQKVNLFRYPSTQPKSGCKRYTGHSSHVTRVRFMLNDNVLVSTGGNDKTLLVWTTDFGAEIANKEDNIFLESEARANPAEGEDEVE